MQMHNFEMKFWNPLDSSLPVSFCDAYPLNYIYPVGNAPKLWVYKAGWETVLAKTKI